jgi:hypothetical protein
MESSFGGFVMKRYGLRDDQFARIETLLPGRPGTVGRNSELGNRLFVEAVIWKFRSGVPWRDFARALRRLEEHPQAFFALGREPIQLQSRKSASNTASIMRATARCSSRSATVGIPNGRVPVLPGPLGISTRRTAGA